MVRATACRPSLTPDTAPAVNIPARSTWPPVMGRGGLLPRDLSPGHRPGREVGRHPRRADGDGLRGRVRGDVACRQFDLDEVGAGRRARVRALHVHHTRAVPRAAHSAAATSNRLRPSHRGIMPRSRGRPTRSSTRHRSRSRAPALGSASRGPEPCRDTTRRTASASSASSTTSAPRSHVVRPGWLRHASATCAPEPGRPARSRPAGWASGAARAASRQPARSRVGRGDRARPRT